MGHSVTEASRPIFTQIKPKLRLISKMDGETQPLHQSRSGQYPEAYHLLKFPLNLKTHSNPQPKSNTYHLTVLVRPREPYSFRYVQNLERKSTFQSPCPCRDPCCGPCERIDDPCPCLFPCAYDCCARARVQHSDSWGGKQVKTRATKKQEGCVHPSIVLRQQTLHGDME